MVLETHQLRGGSYGRLRGEKNQQDYALEIRIHQRGVQYFGACLRRSVHASEELSLFGEERTASIASLSYGQVKGGETLRIWGSNYAPRLGNSRSGLDKITVTRSRDKNSILIYFVFSLMGNRLENRMNFAKYPIEKSYLLHQMAEIHLKSHRFDECCFSARKSIEGLVH